jgi:hypothetical protein
MGFQEALLLFLAFSNAVKTNKRRIIELGEKEEINWAY